MRSPEPSRKRSPARAIRRLPLHHSIVAALREMIQNGELAPGRKINEAELCEEFAISRTPLREALKVLAAEGLIELRPHRGAAVTPIDPAEVAAIFQVIEALERLAGELACRNASRAELAELERLHEQLVALHRAGERNRYFGVNREIHALIIKISGNPVLDATAANCSNKAIRARALANYDARRWEESVAEHEEIMAAFRASDAQLAGELLAVHTRRTGAAVLAALHDIAHDEAPEKLGLRVG